MLQYYRCGYLAATLYYVWEFDSRPLSGIKKHPPLGGYLCISTTVISILNTAFVCYREVVHFSEGPLWEVRLDEGLKLWALTVI